MILAGLSAVPDRADGMDDMPRRQPIPAGDLGAAGFAAVQHPALVREFRSGGAVNGTVDPAAAKQRAIGSVYNRINAKLRDISDDDLKPRRADPSSRKAQADAAALTVIPLSASSCCSSPAWNISRMMSQPPTNSPLTYSCGMVGQFE